VNRSPRRLKNFLSAGEYSWMQAIKRIKTGMRIIPETNDGIFIAVDAVIPEKITAIVMITADQKPKDVSLWFISTNEFGDSFLDMIFLHNYRSDGWQL
jgi:hypothetical protein